MNAIKTILSPDCVFLKQKLPSKKSLIEKICLTLSTHEPTLNARLLFKKFIERERLGTTQLDHGVALPHIRVPALSHPLACFMSLETPVVYNESQNVQCDLILALIVPEDDNQNHLELLAYFARCFHSESFREKLRTSCSHQSIIQLFAQNAKHILSAA